MAVQKRAYHEKVIDHYENPSVDPSSSVLCPNRRLNTSWSTDRRNVGSFAKTDLGIGTGLVGAPACGDVMKLQIKVDDKGVISDVRCAPLSPSSRLR